MGDTGAFSLRHEMVRKGWHALSVVVPVGYARGVARPFLIWMLVAALVVAVVVEVARARSAVARSAFNTGFGALLREHESRGVSGATWLVLAFLIAVIAFPADIAIAAMCGVALGDAAAAIVGRALGGARAHQGKSLAGSAACVAATALAARWIADFTWREALIAGILASIAERPRRPLNDNLRITLAVGCGILLWRMGFS